jgi:hypothetical protein
MITVTSDWHGFWIALTAVYPLERITIAVVAALIGVPLYKVLKSTNLISVTQPSKK